MQVKLTWTMASGTTGQTLQYRLKGTTTWTDITIVNTDPNVTFNSGTNVYTYTFQTGTLLNNKIYEFQISAACSGGTTQASNMVTKYNIICPTVNIVPSSTSATYSITAVTGSDITKYEVSVFDGNNTLIGSTVTYTTVTNTINATITGLTQSTAYTLRVRVFIGSVATDYKDCTYPFTTTTQPPCNAPTNLTACIVGVDCP